MDPEARNTVAADAGWLRTLVLAAGAILRDAAEDRSEVQVNHKGQVDLVTEVDLAIQEALVAGIAAAFPEDHIVAEEADGPPAGPHQRVWYVDPLDGTTNFVHGHPFCAVSVARWVGGEPEVGAVYSPDLDELFLARRGHGATLERPEAGAGPFPISCSSCDRLDDALLGTGFPYHRGATARLNLGVCARALTRVRGLRRAGSAALDLCHVGLGRLDGYWEMGLSDWDVAAGALIAREAGATVTDFEGSPAILASRRIVAAGTGIHTAMREMIAAAHRDPGLDALGPLPETPIPLTGLLPSELT